MTDVLVVDDSVVDRRFVGGLLERAAFHVRLAENGDQALDLLRDARPDLIIADVMMPKVDGLELVERVREEYPMIPIILMTSQGNEQQALRALRHGAASYVPKRLLADELLDTVQHVLSVVTGKRKQSRVMHCLEENVLRFRIENDCQLVTPLVGYLQETISYFDFCSEPDRTRLGIAIEEALINAIFHGNLEVSSDLREEDDDAYRQLIDSRRFIAPYQNRSVYIEARLSRTEARFVVRDEGPGFDPDSLPDPTDPANLDRVCGRGVLLMRTFMDEMSYNERGNEVTMIKRRGEAAESSSVT